MSEQPSLRERVAIAIARRIEDQDRLVEIDCRPVADAALAAVSEHIRDALPGAMSDEVLTRLGLPSPEQEQSP